MFGKKSEDKKLRPLTEKEIQERLYGFYHRSDMVGEPQPMTEEETQEINPSSLDQSEEVTNQTAILSDQVEEQADLFSQPQPSEEVEEKEEESGEELSESEEIQEQSGEDVEIVREDLYDTEESLEKSDEESDEVDEKLEEESDEESEEESEEESDEESQEESDEESDEELDEEEIEEEESSEIEVDEELERFKRNLKTKNLGETTGGMELLQEPLPQKKDWWEVALEKVQEYSQLAAKKTVEISKNVWSLVQKHSIQIYEDYIKKAPAFYIGIASALIISIVGIIIAFNLLSAEGEREKSETSVAVGIPEISSIVEESADTAESQAAKTTSDSSTQKAAENVGVATSPPAAGEKTYSVQLCLSDDIAASKKVIEGLKAKGYEGYIRNIRGSRGNQLYQIFVGRYKSSSEAQKTLKELRKDPEFKNYDDSFVRTSK